ncbi:tRNA pseudouridine synthase A [Arthrobacter sp. H20]|uniref:tRNA pseudouridine synthase A n=1 Tax=Arthrobacter sp. H20 TaxID=1267981 RepID=UPI00047BB829|nr:tRNA pseudouridine synthase A [Arthrobacter sp. H20]
MTELKPAVLRQDSGLLRVRLDLAYDGAPFSGWALQPGLATVQGVIEAGLETVLRRPARLTVAGRTDTGVHARGQVAHVDLTPGEWHGLSRGKEMSPETALLRRLGATISRELNSADSQRHRVPAVVLLKVALAPQGFDARFSALWRRYSYRIADRPQLRDPLARSVTLWHPDELHVDPLNAGARQLLGLQDFRSFVKLRPGATTVRELQRFDFRRAEDGVIIVSVQADAFCHNMVRGLIGSTLRVGTGEKEPQWLLERLQARSKEARSVLAAPHPLVLEEVRYPDDDAIGSRAAETRARRDGSARAEAL